MLLRNCGADSQSAAPALLTAHSVAETRVGKSLDPAGRSACATRVN
jgi:hypothetical protein